MEIELAPPPKEDEKILPKSFANLKMGDHITALAEITQIKYDENSDPPTWVLYYLYDGTSTIRVFRNRILPFKVGDFVKIDLDVLQGKPYKNKPQFNYRAIFMRRIETEDPRYTELLKNLEYKAILRKSELQEFPDETRIKIFTKITDLHPSNGEKDKYQKILITDIQNKPISLWLPKECLPLLEALEENEYFVLKATIKAVEQNPSLKYLSFESYIQGKDAYTDSVARLFFEERIYYHSKELDHHLRLWKTHVGLPNQNIDLLILIIQNFRRAMYQ